ncbi:MAG TPA: YciI family protein [Anaeromyxobacter sp.]|nr:YciI family protein [Anaeromyxobacter sp.]
MAAFMLLFRGSDTRGDSPEQLQQYMKKWLDWFEGLKRSGAYDGHGAPLETTGKVVRGTRRAVSDGPYAEAKDLVGGYAIVEAKDVDAAVEIARGCPIYDKDGAVEIRPVRAM